MSFVKVVPVPNGRQGRGFPTSRRSPLHLLSISNADAPKVQISSIFVDYAAGPEMAGNLKFENTFSPMRPSRPFFRAIIQHDAFSNARERRRYRGAREIHKKVRRLQKMFSSAYQQVRSLLSHFSALKNYGESNGERFGTVATIFHLQSPFQSRQCRNFRKIAMTP